MTYEQREELNTLSEKYMGSRRKWQKLVEKGMAVPAYETVETVITDENGESKTVQNRRPMTHGGKPVMEMKTMTVEAVLQELRQIDQIHKQAEAERQKKAETMAKVHDELSGMSGA